ncbi:E3 ubiquitin-protein ligase TRIM71-like [Saccostrea cucullata]|uniref:E3 ubiquitin-protein ligase TRIM71-like n=1 Tax=Saccostrea cuccullata TaxID=36930 RepID=UPI002ED153EB
MAENSSLLAQDPVRCEFCKASNAESVCKICNDRICAICEKIHHNIHSNSEIKSTKLEKVQGFCKHHPRNRYEVCCYDCRVPVCTTCIIDNHNKHKMVKMSVLFEEDKNAIVEDIGEMKSKIYPEIELIAQSAKSIKESIPSKCQMVVQYLKARAEKAKEQIDKFFKEAVLELREMEKKDVKAFQEHIAQIDDILSRLKKTASLYEGQLHTRYESDLILFRRANPEISIFRTIPDTLKYSPPFFKGGKLEKAKLSKFFGELQPSSIKHTKVRKIRQKTKRSDTKAALLSSLENILSIPASSSVLTPATELTPPKPISRSTSMTNSAKSVQHFKRSYSVLTSVNCVSTEKAWISGQHPDVKLMDLQSGECDTISTDCETVGPSDLTITKDNDIIFSDFYDRSVKQLTIETKEMQVIFRTDWNPKGLCCGNDGDVFVCLVENQNGKVSKFKKGGLSQEFINGVDGQRLFEQPSYICQNSNSDLCISDTGKRAVIVLDATGNKKFAYSGSDADGRSPFDPRGIDTEVGGNIVVVDYGNHEVILISETGKFLTCLLDRSDGLSRPCDVSVDGENKLWVAECRTGRLKVFQSISEI